MKRNDFRPLDVPDLEVSEQFRGSSAPPWRARVAVSALLASTALAPAAVAAPPPLFNAAWLAARGTARAIVPGAGSTLAGAATASAARVQQSVAAMQRAAQAINVARVAQQAARASALAGIASVPNGLRTGGLQVAAGATAEGAAWQGADLPTQQLAGQHAAVTVRQRARQAVLTWQSFNVGRETSLTFDQSAGGAGANTWVALNRVLDPYAQPSRILGSISAPGQVYVINRNGVIFGGSSQVSVGALLASSADISTSRFLRSGIYSPNATTASFVNGSGAITVEAGAAISTAAPGAVTSGGGFVLLMGSQVTNAGSIATPSGQAGLVAGRDIVILPGYGSNADPLATVQGNQLAVSANGGSVANTGLIEAANGDVTLVGRNVTQAGVIHASTGLGQRGTVHLLTDLAEDKRASVTLAPGSTTAITIDASTDTAIEALRSGVTATNATTQLNNASGLADVRNRSRVEISSGGSIDFAAGSLTLANSGQVAAHARGGLFLASGALVDVSGLVGVSRPVSSNAVGVAIEPFNLRDSPNNRETGALNSQTGYVDARSLQFVAGTAADPTARFYSGGGLVELGGELGNAGFTIADYSTTGGSVVLSATSVVAQPGSSINLAGGTTQYQGGPVPQTWLLGADGRLYNLNRATDAVVYTAIFDGFKEVHSRWNVTKTFYNPLIAPSSITEAGYTVGAGAGSLVLSTPTLLFEGGVQGGATPGARQTTAAVAGRSGLLVNQIVVPQSGTLAIAAAAGDTRAAPTRGLLSGPQPIDVTIDAEGLGIAATLSAGSRIPGALRDTAVLAASVVNESGLGTLRVESLTTIAVGAPVQVADGGGITLSAPVIAVAAPLVARGGSVSLSLPTDRPPAPTVRRIGVTVDQGGTLDTRGVWTNGRLDGALGSGAAWVNGGSVAIRTFGSITLAPGSVIDASAGGAISVAGALTGGAGGDITLIADDIVAGNTLSSTPGPKPLRGLVLGGNLRSLGVTHGGTLTLQAPGLAIGDGLRALYPGELVLSPSRFADGFARYVLTSQTNVRIAPGAQVNVAEPVYQATTASLLLPSGSDPGGAYQVILPPLFLEDPRRATLTQRVGASLVINAPGERRFSTSRQLIDGPENPYGRIAMGAGSSIAVDPGQSVILNASLSATIDGSITARGGTIEALVTDLALGGLNQALGAYSVSVGTGSRLDVSGLATTAVDFLGRPYGAVTAGGLIVLGNTAGPASGGQMPATDAFVIVRPGATLDASGAAASIDLSVGQSLLSSTATDMSMLVGSQTDGGTIRLASYSGIVIDGALRAAPGGGSAAGGTLEVLLETGIYTRRSSDVEPVDPRQDPYLVPRVIRITQRGRDAASLVPSPASIGVGRLSAEGIAAGGFGSLSLFARDAIVFQGDVALALPQSAQLVTGALAEQSFDGSVLVSAPRVLLAGTPTIPTEGLTATSYAGFPSSATTHSTVDIVANLLDIRGALAIGTSGMIQIQNSKSLQPSYDFAGFGTTRLTSAGDIRLLYNPDPADINHSTSLSTFRDLTLTAAQVYPVTNANGTLAAGFTRAFSFYINTFRTIDLVSPAATLTISRVSDLAPVAPLSAFGRLTLRGPTIEQGGVLRAPFGRIAVGDVSSLFQPIVNPDNPSVTITPRSITFLPGSITSVSANGLSIPYGGTSDGINYTYAGASATFNAATQTEAQSTYGVTVVGSAVSLQAGATLDLSGGGTLAGEGFISGRGGSGDTLFTPLRGTPGAATALGAGDRVLALLPTRPDSYAPTSPRDAASGYSGSLPAIGEFVAVGDGIPGLPAGQYALLPSYYALQPGAYRIELRTGSVPLATGPQALPNGSYLASVTTGIANTSISRALPVTAIVTPGATVRGYSQYNETGYAAFARSQAPVAVFGNVLPVLPDDAGQLNLVFGKPRARMTALVNDSTNLLEPAPGGLGSSLIVSAADPADSLILGTAATRNRQAIVVDTAPLNRFGAVSLVVAAGNSQTTSDITITTGAALTAAQILLVSTGQITVQPNATLSTVGRAGSLLDASSGLAYRPTAGSAVLVLSNSGFRIQSTDNAPQAGIGIRVGAGASLFAGDTLTFSTQQVLDLAPDAHFGARRLSLTATEVNVGQPPTVANARPSGGLLLDQALLQALISGDAAAGIPGLQELDITASRSVNFFGSTTLDTTDPATGQSRLKQFVLNTPAIEGLGGPGDVAVLTVGTLYWNGFGSTVSNSGTLTTVPVQPPLVAAGGPGTGTGTLSIQSRQIVFGYGPSDLVDNSVTLPRAILGFGAVTIGATEQIVAANRGSLLVAQAPGPVQSNGTASGLGGALTLSTPLLTAASAGTLDVTAGGPLTINPGLGVPSTATPDAAGGQISLTAASIAATSAIVLPTGRLVLQTVGDIALGVGARLDVTGRSRAIFDQVVGGPGGEIMLSSAAGNVTASPGSAIAFGGSTGQAAGRVGISAAQGTVALAASLAAGGSDAVHSGGFTIDAGTLAPTGFSGLNQALTGAGIVGSRSFRIGSGDLTITTVDQVRAHLVDIAVDGGSLTVDGMIDASGTRVGSIGLSGQTGLRLTGNAVLAARGSALVSDSYGLPIAASNRAHASLTAGSGPLSLAAGATIDLGSADGVARGDLELNAPRGSLAGDILIDAAGPLAIRGAATVALNGFTTYHSADGLVTQATLDAIGLDDTAFIAAALGNAGLQGRVAGLLGPAFHLRPSVIIDGAAATNPTGDLRVVGDLDLSGLRTFAAATSTTPAEPGVLVLRAAGNLYVNGSISDGFAPPPGSPDDAGWVRFQNIINGDGTEPNGQPVTVLTSVTLDKTTTFIATDLALTYDLPLADNTSVRAGAVVPVPVKLSRDVRLTIDWIAGATITLGGAGGQVIAAGQVLRAGSTLPAGTRLAAGSTLPTAFRIAAVTWPAGNSLGVLNVATGSDIPSTLRLSAAITLKPGDVIPGDTNVAFTPADAKLGYVAVRPTGTDGTQGRIDALAALLPAGSLSWSLALVSGADLAAADPTKVVSAGAAGRGDLILDDVHYGSPSLYLKSTKVGFYGGNDTASFSVIRTGTGSLTLAAAGTIAQQSSFGIYTSGTQAAAIRSNGLYEPAPISRLGLDGAPQYQQVVRAQLAQGYQPYYAADGGDLAVTAGRNIAVLGLGAGLTVGSDINLDQGGGWLWQQAGPGRPTSWWINFGTYAPVARQGQYDLANPLGIYPPPLAGFTGFGALGGGNVSLRAGGNAGAVGNNPNIVRSSDGLTVAVGSTGRVTQVASAGQTVTGGRLVATGGGDILISVAGAINPLVLPDGAQSGILTNTRGTIEVSAGSIGVASPIYGKSSADPRFVTDVLNAETAAISSGVTLAIGDGVANLSTRGNLVLTNAVDPGRTLNNFFFLSAYSGPNAEPDVLLQGFSLWTSRSAVSLVSAGGNLLPNSSGVGVADQTLNNISHTYPPALLAAAPYGNIYFGLPNSTVYPLELAPSASGALSLVAGASIYGFNVPNGVTAIAISGAPASPDDLSNPFKPFYRISGSAPLTNATDIFVQNAVPTSLFAFTEDTPSGSLHAPGAAPIRAYAATGDIVSLTIGSVVNQSATIDGAAFAATWYGGSLPGIVRAGRDIVGFGQLNAGSAGSPGLFVNNTTSDISVLSAGRDIIYANADVAGPGLLYVQAGRNVYQADRGVISSLGVLAVDPNVSAADRSTGAAITTLAGLGAAGPDFRGFANLYFDEANQANLSVLLSDASNAGKVQQTYGPALLEWLRANAGYSGDAAGALPAFLALPVEQQSRLVLPIYFDELRQSGRQFTDSASRFYRSYGRGRQAIGTLLPGGYQGDLTLFNSATTTTVFGVTTIDARGSGINTQFGGDITVLAPGGGVTLGVADQSAPPSTAGLITFGSGNVDIYSRDSVLLGQSRVFTTFGGGITIWSAEGDINAGRGAKSTVVAQPFQLVYDDFGNITLSPAAPSSGGGIATLADIPGTVPGDVDLIAPQGTIDAGEAGIRSSGNANLAALAIANAANIGVKGKVTGVPTVSVPNIGALTSAAAVAGAGQQTAQKAGAQRQRAPSDSIITVEVLGFGA